MAPEQARATLTAALQHRKADSPEVFGALKSLSTDLTARVAGYGSLGAVPAEATPNVRNDMYLVLDTARLVLKKPAGFTPEQVAAITQYQVSLEEGTRFIPPWVKIVVALALGLGTMVGWKRIVITVGERIGKQHMTYGMGATAELVAAGTILMADRFGLPVSTTHILSSGVAGASVASGAGLRGRTIAQLAAAWLLTLPVAMALSGGLYWLMLQIVHAMSAG